MRKTWRDPYLVNEEGVAEADHCIDRSLPPTANRTDDVIIASWMIPETGWPGLD